MITKEVKISELTVDGDGFININEFKDILDISKVVSYKLSTLKNKSLSLIFYDKDNNVIKPYCKNNKGS